MNARSPKGVISYERFFTQIATLDSSATIRNVTREVSFAIELNEMVSDDRSADDRRYFAGRVIAGSPGEVPLYFDYNTGETEEGATPEGKWLAQLSALTVGLSPAIRYLALQGGRNGVTATRLARYFSILAESVLNIGGVEFDIVPVQSDSLRSDIESFERIKQASAIVTRPNFDWNDMSDKLSTLAEESSGHEAEATVRASRRGSLSKSGGIIGTILASLSMGSPAVRKFRVTGRKPNSGRDTVVTSEKHQERIYVQPLQSASEDSVDHVFHEQGRVLIESKSHPAPAGNDRPENPGSEHGRADGDG
ncbi:hypothetical protein [Mycobacterium sp. ITM-2016-00318]|uniref:hypothetical protein n=1 Tax=Mycobacterium sp. ITM-2016-00318 TaxID=2099693 RepID=UPI001156D6C1|nr:hypothetical protein [Mycobacterium sp. ITM-2016-00318]WNG93671.1 hypothetical protein C6A82_004160 [Mycobacterium sp. ITM-2016-00318]